MTETWKLLGGYFGECGWNITREFALIIPRHMMHDVLGRFNVIRWTDGGYPVVKSTFEDLIGLIEWCCDMYRYGFEILWNGK